MIYLKNTTAPQEVWIPRQDTNIQAVHKDCYTEGYDDGYNSGYEDGMKEGIPLQEKSVTISGDVTEVLPDAGYSAMTKVTADATEYAQGRYDAGYADGKAEFRLQSKTYEVTGDTGNVTPDDEYDGLSRVTVDAVMYGKSKYNEGHSEGYTSGYSEGQASVRLQEKSVSSNTATVEVTPDEGYSGMTKVSVDSSAYGEAQYESGYSEGQESVRIQAKSVEITGDTQVITPDEGYMAMSSVTADAGTYGQERYDEGVADGKNSIRLQTKAVDIVENGAKEIYPDDDYDGISKVIISTDIKIDAEKYDLKFGYSDFANFPEFQFDITNVKDASYLFYHCSNLYQLDVIPKNPTNVTYMFSNCQSLKKITQNIDLNLCDSMNYMFSYCRELEEISQLINTQNIVYSSSLFEYCIMLKKVPSFDASNLRGNNIFGYSWTSNLIELTDFGGLLNLKASITDGGFEKTPNLTLESCLNILNGLYDFTGHGETPGENEGTLKVHQNFLDKVGDSISIATNKGWNITT